MSIHGAQGKVGELIGRLLDEARWVEARSFIKKELKKTPSDHWLLTRLGTTYYEQRQYKKALEVTEKALRLVPRCPLSLWDYANCLDMLGREEEAIQVWQRLLKREVNALAYGLCGEGKKWAEELVNDCRYRIGLAYADTGHRRAARFYLQAYLKNRTPNRRGIYSLKEVKEKIGLLESGARLR